MKYLIINGSPRQKNTWKIVEQVKTNLNGEFDEIHLIAEQIPSCIGCYNCIIEGEHLCPHNELIQPIVSKMLQCDALIITSPVYAMNVTALLKNFFDHTAYLFHRREFFTKKALVIVTTAGAGHKKVSKYMSETLGHWGFNKVYRIAITCGGREFLDTKDIDKVSREFGEDVESSKLHSPKIKDIFYYQVWRAMALIDNPIKADKEYWFGTGLVYHDFAPEVKLNIFKKVIAKVMFKILRKMIK